MGKLQKIDNRINYLFKSGVNNHHRSIIVMFGEKSQDQVPIMHHIYQTISHKTCSKILWCYKKDLAFSTHRKKNLKLLNNRRKAGLANEGTIFEQFICANSIRWCYYSETQNILGQTFDICILQDFEALTPNCIARTIETVVGGGLVIFLLKSVTSLKQFCAMAMDVHSRYRTEAHQDVVCRFNERFLLSLAYNDRCLVLDDKWRIFPLSARTLKKIESYKEQMTDVKKKYHEEELEKLKTSLKEDGSIFAPIVNLCATLCQSKCILNGAKAISKISKIDNSLLTENDSFNRAILVITASRGRGKSAALGLCLSAAIHAGLPNIQATSPAPENLNVVMEFAVKGLKALGYQEHVDFNVARDNEVNSSIIKIEIVKRSYRQMICYVNPWDAAKQASLNLNSADLMVIDEAASIPIVLLKKFIQSPKLVFMASTINGYEGTGRSLSYKLLNELRSQCKKIDPTSTTSIMNNKPASDKSDVNLKPFDHSTALFECTMTSPIRYADGDAVESWLNKLLCLDCEVKCNTSTPEYYPPLDQCELFYVNRDTLFSYHKASETFLNRLMSLYVASHYKNSPNDLQMLSDAPSHHLFCLLPPYNPKSSEIPEILCVIQVCMEGEINQDVVKRSLARGLKPSGDLVPWVVSQQFCTNQFGSLSGGRIIRIATHPNYQGIGYGTKAMSLLSEYYSQPSTLSASSTGIKRNGHTTPHNESDQEEDVEEEETDDIQQIDQVLGSDQDAAKQEKRVSFEKFTEESIRSNETKLPPLLSRLSERPNESLDYLGVSFGVTPSILKFWKRSGFFPVYIRQKINSITGEYSCVMIKRLSQATVDDIDEVWESSFLEDFRKRFFRLCPGPFKSLDSAFALDLVSNKLSIKEKSKEIGKTKLGKILTNVDLKRLHLYVNSLIDYPVINDLVSILANLYFTHQLPSVRLTVTHQIVLFSLGLQHKTIDETAGELERNSRVTTEKLRRKSEIFDENAFSSVLSAFIASSGSGGGGASITDCHEENKTDQKARDDPKFMWQKRVKGLFFSVIKELVTDIERILNIEFDDEQDGERAESDDNEMIMNQVPEAEGDQLMEIDNEAENEELMKPEIQKRKNLVMELLAKETSLEQLESCSVKGSDQAWRQNTAIKGSDLKNVKILENDIHSTQMTIDKIKKSEKRKGDHGQSSKQGGGGKAKKMKKSGKKFK